MSAPLHRSAPASCAGSAGRGAVVPAHCCCGRSCLTAQRAPDTSAGICSVHPAIVTAHWRMGVLRPLIGRLPSATACDSPISAVLTCTDGTSNVIAIVHVWKLTGRMRGSRLPYPSNPHLSQ